MEVKAKFAQLTAKQGKTVMQFELDEACEGALPDLTTLTGRQVMLGVDDPQRRLDLDGAAEGPGQEPLPIGGLLPEQARAVEAEVEDVGDELAEEAV